MLKKSEKTENMKKKTNHLLFSLLPRLVSLRLPPFRLVAPPFDGKLTRSPPSLRDACIDIYNEIIIIFHSPPPITIIGSHPFKANDLWIGTFHRFRPHIIIDHPSLFIGFRLLSLSWASSSIVIRLPWDWNYPLLPPLSPLAPPRSRSFLINIKQN